jgi:hypothetical protein
MNRGRRKAKEEDDQPVDEPADSFDTTWRPRIAVQDEPRRRSVAATTDHRQSQCERAAAALFDLSTDKRAPMSSVGAST